MFDIYLIIGFILAVRLISKCNYYEVAEGAFFGLLIIIPFWPIWLIWDYYVGKENARKMAEDTKKYNDIKRNKS